MIKHFAKTVKLHEGILTVLMSPSTPDNGVHIIIVLPTDGVQQLHPFLRFNHEFFGETLQKFWGENNTENFRSRQVVLKNISWEAALIEVHSQMEMLLKLHNAFLAGYILSNSENLVFLREVLQTISGSK